MDIFDHNSVEIGSSAIKQEPLDDSLSNCNKVSEDYVNQVDLVDDRDCPEFVNLDSFHSNESSSRAHESSWYLNPLASANQIGPISDELPTDGIDGNDYFSDEDQTDGSNCRVCKQSFLDTNELVNHFKSRRLGDRKYKCCNCDKIFRDNTQLKVHVRKHTGERPYECKVCAKKFSVNGNLNKHMRIHTGERRFECDTCERKFTQFAHLEDHQKIHSGERPYVCDYCQAAFKTKARLKKHTKSHEEDKDSKRAVRCPRCYTLLRNMKQLAGHLATHDQPNTAYSCIFCGKSFDKYPSLQVHQKTHSGERAFQCKFCDRAFTNASHLRRHNLSHSGVRPFTCNICNRGFPSQQNMKRHLMTHTGEKPFSCETCQRGFLTLENLNRHKRTHTGEKPFSCETCGRKFAHSTTAKEHQRIHTGAKPFVCTVCNKCFALSKLLFKHVREKHPKYFPEFQKINSLPLNMKRALDKLKREKETDGVGNAPGVPEVVLVNGKVKVEPKDEEDKDNVSDGVAEVRSPMVKIEKTEEQMEEVEEAVEEKVITQLTNVNCYSDSDRISKNINSDNQIQFIKVEKTDYCEGGES